MIESPRHRGRSRRDRILAGLAVTGLVAVPFLDGRALAQDGGGFLATLGVTSGLLLEDDDDEGDSSALQTQLTFGLSSITRAQRLNFALTGLFDLADPSAEDPFRPSATLAYAIESRDTVLTVNGSLQTVDVDTLFFDPDDEFGDDEFDADDLTSQTGTRSSAVVSFGLETGRTARFGTLTTLTLRDRSYSNTTDPGLTDLRSFDIGSTLRFALTRTADLRLTGSRYESDEDDMANTERERTRVGVGIDAALDRAWTLSLDLGRGEYVTRTTTGGVVAEDIEDGLEISALAQRTMRNGTLSFSAARRIDENGFQDTVQVSRALELSRGSALDLGVGLISFEDGDSQPFFDVGYSKDLKRGAIAVSLAQSGGVTDDGDSVVRTTGSASYRRALTPRSSLSVTGRLAALDVVSGTGSDTSRAEVGLGYTYDVTRDWGLTGAVSHRAEYSDGDRDNTTNTLSLNVSRSFAFRP